ncbi:MAG TPA: phosphatidate cytidylyltransferase [Candidatus Hydrogenedentes bacterium]|nr:phosphatidate cytidylyltransferase [Candidatus Hydrogenedentota bacterium]HOL76101.1 phosphatidate cytidylyltransferase [Candidatus Hydrogenedentota bacterium]HPO84715.1 phosphatidate cytidylyltransferase [Candidatus Hydrogenedentota bacterium]
MSSKTQRILLRIVTATVVLPVVLFLIWSPRFSWGFALFVAFLSGVGLYEYYAIVRARAISPETIGGIVAGVLVTISGYGADIHVTNFVLWGGLLLVASLHIVRGQHSVAGLTSSAFGVFYVGWFSAHVLLIQRTPGVGPLLVTFLFVVVVLTDTAAYVVGSLAGAHPLAPKVSPRKTWEGAFGGFLAALVGVALLHVFWQKTGAGELPGWNIWSSLKAAALMSIVAQIGDLTESCLKRDAGVKDSGAFFPGHGGVLDRCDGFLFAAPILYYIYVPNHDFM